ncbi:MAG: hypothetical protein VKJ85_10195 [Prochlorothrix sp.]|nr:hypothetical protein [Prochlorothrix sp.]
MTSVGPLVLGRWRWAAGVGTTAIGLGLEMLNHAGQLVRSVPVQGPIGVSPVVFAEVPQHRVALA